MKPLELAEVNKGTYLIYEKLTSEYDSYISAMELNTKPIEKDCDIAGVDEKSKIRRISSFSSWNKYIPYSGCHCITITKFSVFFVVGTLSFRHYALYIFILKIIIGATMFFKIRRFSISSSWYWRWCYNGKRFFCFSYREKAPIIIFIDEIDAEGGNRCQEVQRIMLELLNQLI